jgi:hypothetical protein
VGLVGDLDERRANMYIGLGTALLVLILLLILL